MARTWKFTYLKGSNRGKTERIISRAFAELLGNWVDAWDWDGNLPMMEVSDVLDLVLHAMLPTSEVRCTERTIQVGRHFRGRAIQRTGLYGQVETEISEWAIETADGSLFELVMPL